MNTRTAKQTTAIAAFAAAIFTAAACSSAPPPINSDGTVTLESGLLSGGNVQDTYPDITSGSQVTVTDSAGAVIGTGTLAYSSADTAAFLIEALAGEKGTGLTATEIEPDVAVYSFSASVPGGLARYGLTVGRSRGVVWDSAAQMKDPVLTLGSLSG